MTTDLAPTGCVPHAAPRRLLLGDGQPAAHRRGIIGSFAFAGAIEKTG